MSKPWRTSKLREVRKWEATWPKKSETQRKKRKLRHQFFLCAVARKFLFQQSKPLQALCWTSTWTSWVQNTNLPFCVRTRLLFQMSQILLKKLCGTHSFPEVCSSALKRLVMARDQLWSIAVRSASAGLFTSAAVFKKKTLTCVQLSLAACSSCAICGNSWKTCLCFFNACRKRNFATDRLPSLSLLSPRKKANKFCQSLVIPASPQLVYAASSWPEQTQLIFYVKLNLLSMVYVVADSSIYNSNQFITQQFRKFSVKSPHNFFINLVRIIQDWERDGGLPLLIINLFAWRCPPVAL